MTMLPQGALPWILGVLGAFIGSFLNVCIYRMPAHKSIVYPGSACPSCGASIRAWQNIPIVSWLFLRGRCASCRAAISWRYPFVEALTSALFVVAFLRFGTGWALVGALVFLSSMVVLFFTDLDERILPDLVTLPGTAAGVAFTFLVAAGWPFKPWGPVSLALRAAGISALAGLGAGGALWLVGRFWRLVRPGIESAMGDGDVKMMAMVGAFLGGRLSLLTVFLGSILGTLIFLLTRLLLLVLPALPGPLRRGLESAGFLVEGRGAGLLDQIPFGSMLAIGAAVSLLWGGQLVGAYTALSLGFGDWILRLLHGGA